MTRRTTSSLSDDSQDDVTFDEDTLYTSDNAPVATVGVTGLITAVADGVATVTVSRTDTTVPTVEVTVYVTTEPVYSSLVVTPDGVTELIDLLVGEAQQLMVDGIRDMVCDPSQTDDLTMDDDTLYASDATEVADVDLDGEITAMGPGDATITVSRADGSVPAVQVPVTVADLPLEATIDITSGDDDEDGIVMPGDEIGLDVLVDGGTGSYTFDWNVDASGTTDPDTGDDDVFGLNDMSQMVTFTPPVGVEGTYVITCVVVDELETEVIPTLSIIATTLTADPVVEDNDGCIVGLPSGIEIPAGDDLSQGTL